MYKFQRILIIVLLVVGCAKERRPYHEQLAGDIFIAALYSNTAYQYSNCRQRSGEANQLYLASEYGPKFMSDIAQYKTVIVGDSTMDYSSRIPGWLGQAQSVAVAGNTLCDMQEQLPAIHSINPEWIVIATGGGNDVLRKYDATLNGKELVENIRYKWSNTNIALVGIHETVVDYANIARIEVNKELSSIVDCYVEPVDVVLIDAIHYDKETAEKIKRELNGRCGISF